MFNAVMSTPVNMYVCECGIMRNTLILSPQHALIVPFQLPFQTFQQKGLAGSWQTSDLAGEGAGSGTKAS